MTNSTDLNTTPGSEQTGTLSAVLSNTPKTLDFYFEMGSPYAYVAAEKIDALAALYDFKVRWKPIFLGILFKQTGAAALTTAHPWKSSYFMHDFGRNARLNGVPYVQPTKFPVAISPLSYFLNFGHNFLMYSACSMAFSFVTFFFPSACSASDSKDARNSCRSSQALSWTMARFDQASSSLAL